MILIDTNVWVSFFKGDKKALWIKDAIIEDQAILHPYIYGELLLGGISEKTETMLQALATTTVLDQNLVFQFIRTNKLHSKGVGWVDVNILMSALSENHRVCTYGKNLLQLCRDYHCHMN